MGHMYLIIVDSHSKWLDIQIMQSISTSKTFEKLRFLLLSMDYHKLLCLIIDHPSQVMSLRSLCKLMELDTTSAPYHPSTNGLMERALQTVKQGLKQINDNSVKEILSRVLWKYRIILHTTTGIPPS